MSYIGWIAPPNLRSVRGSAIFIYIFYQNDVAKICFLMIGLYSIISSVFVGLREKAVGRYDCMLFRIT